MKKTYEFKSQHLQYRTIKESDSSILVSWRSNPNITQYYCNPLPITEESHKDWFCHIYKRDNTRWDFLALDGKVPVGFVALTHIDYENKAAEISYTIGNRDYTGRNLSVEMIKSICDLGKSIFGICEFTAQIHRDNIISQRAAVTSGFVLEDTSEKFWKYRKRID